MRKDMTRTFNELQTQLLNSNVELWYKVHELKETVEELKVAQVEDTHCFVCKGNNDGKKCLYLVRLQEMYQMENTSYAKEITQHESVLLEKPFKDGL